MRPQWPYRVNWRSPQARGLTGWWPVIPSGTPAIASYVRNLLPAGVHFSNGQNFVPDYVTDMELRSALEFVPANFDELEGPTGTATITAAAGTLSAWLKITGNSETTSPVYNLPRVISDSSLFFGLHYGELTAGGHKLHAYNWDGSDDHVSITISQGVWHQVAWVHGAGTLYLYVDGVPTSVASGDTQDVTGTLMIGQEVNDRGWPGRIADIRTYNVALPAAVVYQMWHPATRWDLYAPYRLPWAAQFEAPPPPPNAPVFRLRRTA